MSMDGLFSICTAAFPPGESAHPQVVTSLELGPGLAQSSPRQKQKKKGQRLVKAMLGVGKGQSCCKEAIEGGQTWTTGSRW